ncbi:hypothetical protein [Nocardioides stalactiti]|uniref:hypothetical protein n=1 Tax=Nocardioides stalactiti TaxID=2755356 RepID=UPI0016031EE9|nr:hypothetical protein [Nocardioides stalactiti]
MSARRTTRVAASLAVVCLLGLSGCQDDAATPSDDPDRVVLEPPADGAGHTHAPGQDDPTTVGDGTTTSAGGYRLDGVRLPRGTDGPGGLSFRVLGRDGQPLRDYTEEQTKLLHLYLVRSDLAVFRHLHPTMAADGTWSARADLGSPGDYRLIADFVPAGTESTVILGADVTVPGQWQPDREQPTGDDGVLKVRVDGSGTVGPDGRLRLVVSSLDDRPVTLGSYLGAAAHVSGFRTDGDDPRGRTFVHVHPYGAPEDGEDGTVLTFHTTFEKAGDYRLFVQVRVGGLLHTVPVTARVAGP